MSSEDIRFSLSASGLPDRAAAVAEAKRMSALHRGLVRVERDDGAERLVFAGGRLLEFWYEAGGRPGRGYRG
ncbi:MAG: hypothetical protein ABIO70_07000 [Pseudomonadota bacterium]